jgi:hypothetical protein
VQETSKRRKAMADSKKLANVVQNSLKGDLEYLFKGLDMTVVSGDFQGTTVGLDKMLGNHAAVKTRLVAS